jgi:hypothetical protein
VTVPGAGRVWPDAALMCRLLAGWSGLGPVNARHPAMLPRPVHSPPEARRDVAPAT